jgi:hypothetical protein
MLRVLTKIADADPKAGRPYHVFRDYHTRETFSFIQRHGDICCRARVGADVLALTSKPGWAAISLGEPEIITAAPEPAVEPSFEVEEYGDYLEEVEALT